MTDCLLDALADLRAQGNQIPIWDADRREGWFDGLAELMAQLHNEDQQLAWVGLIAADLCRRRPGLSLSVAAGPLLDRLVPSSAKQADNLRKMR